MNAANPRPGLLLVCLTVLPTPIGSRVGAGVSAAEVAGGGLIFAYAGMQVLFALLIVLLSDRLGRRPVLPTAVGRFGSGNPICALAPTLPWLSAGRIRAGISGGSLTTAGAHIADVTPPDRQAKSFGLMGMAFGFAVAPTGSTMPLVILPFAFIGLIEPSLRAIATRAVPDTAQGGWRGAAASQRSLAMVLSPLLMTQVSGGFAGADAPADVPGVPFLLAAPPFAAGTGGYGARRAPAVVAA